MIGEAIFHFLPVGITWSVDKKMGGNQILGIILGILTVKPQYWLIHLVAMIVTMGVTFISTFIYTKKNNR